MRAYLLSFLLIASLLFVVPSQANHVDDGEIDWACGGSRSGHPDQCGIDPVGGDGRVNSEGDPEFAADWPGSGLDGDARVLGIIVDDDVRAYPVRMLNTHEIVNDVVGGEKVTVTFCPLCGSGVSFLRELEFEGRTVETNFTASGYLFRTDMVMWDPETNQLWNQITGQSIAWLDSNEPASVGHEDLELDLIPTTITTWDNWRQKHPDTLLLQPVFSPGSYREDAYAVTSSENCQHGFSGKTDCDVEGIHPKVQVVGHDDGTGGVAFPVLEVALNGGAVPYETQEGRTFVGAADAEGDARIYDAGDRTFTSDGSGLWTDQDGGLWDLRRGERVDAPGRLEQVDTSYMFWFAWHDHFPETEAWLPEGGVAPPPPDGRGIPGPGTVALAGFLLLAAAFTRKRS